MSGAQHIGMLDFSEDEILNKESAFEKAKTLPKTTVFYRGEDDVRSVRYVSPTEEDTTWGGFAIEAVPGYWYDKEVSGEATPIGVRIYDHKGNKDAEV